jgi:hypothetical protein
VVVIDALLQRADWTTGEIPAQHQPRSVAELAGWAGISRSTCQTAVAIGREYGWISVKSPPVLRRGQSSTYRVDLGWARRSRRPEPLSGAERMRRYRQRLKQRDETPGT